LKSVFDAERATRDVCDHHHLPRLLNPALIAGESTGRRQRYLAGHIAERRTGTTRHTASLLRLSSSCADNVAATGIMCSAAAAAVRASATPAELRAWHHLRVVPPARLRLQAWPSLALRQSSIGRSGPTIAAATLPSSGPALCLCALGAGVSPGRGGRKRRSLGCLDGGLRQRHCL